MLRSVIDALNAIHDNLLALGIIIVGAFLCHRDPAVGGNLITLGAAVFQRSSAGNQQLTTLNLSDHKESKQ